LPPTSGLFSESTIAQSEDERLFLANKNIIRTNLLYKSTRDGWARSTFHARCDNKGATITLVKLPNGRRFGGYASLSWDSSNTWINDYNSYLFSLDNKLRIPAKNGRIFRSAVHGPYFGDSSSCNLCQYSGDTARNYHAGSQGASGSDYPVTLDAAGNNILTGMKPGDIVVSEVEVWQVLF
jgi:hypothetical protein